MPMALWPPLLLLLVVAAAAAAAAADPMCPDGVCSSSINTTGSDANSTTTTSTTSSPETTFLPTIAPLETTTMKDSTTEMPTTVTNMTPTTTPSSRNGKGRAMSDTNDTIKGSLEDLNLDDIDMDILDMKNTTSTQSTTNRSNNESINKILNSTNSSSQDGCISDAVHYVVGDVFNRGCEETCKCETSGEIKCAARCSTPFQRKGRGATDEFCVEKDVTDPCCALLVCTQHEEPTEDSCHYKNVTLKHGETHNDGCESVCLCGDDGVINCKPRCAPTKSEDSDRCLTLPDPTDPCCMVVRCDVTLSDHESDSTDTNSGFAGLQVLSAEPVNATAVRLQIVPESASSNISLESSLNRGLSWQTQSGRGLIATDLPPGKLVYLRVKNPAGRYSNPVEVLLPEQPLAANGESGCTYKGTKYQFGSEFHDGCEAYCVCLNVGVQCANIECPTQLGLEVLDPHCTEWEVEPADFVANPPECCPKNVTCRSNGSCIHEGKRYDNWQEVSAGCERRCYCENGTVTCQEACPPIPATPPAGLACPPTMAILGLMPGDQCCKIWMCPHDHEGPLPPPRPSPGFDENFRHPGLQLGPAAQDLIVEIVEALDPTTVRLVFSVPSILIGLHGRVELRYTPDRLNEDPMTWEQQIHAPPSDLIATPRLEFVLGGLLPDTTYKLRIALLMRDIHNSPVSSVISVRTPALTTTSLPPTIPIDAQLTAVGVNATWARITWRKLTDAELQLVDGVQLRYKEYDAKLYQDTPLIHRAVTEYTLEDLKPQTPYEVRVFFIPFHGQSTELQADRSLEFTTTQILDQYKFEVELLVHHVKSSSVELSWSGVPYPEDKYVNIFRAIYQSDGGKEDVSTFKVAKRDSQPRTVVDNLKPGTRYRLWLEVYLTNGKIKKSNVQDFITKPGTVPSVGESLQGKLAAGVGGISDNNHSHADYYNSLVGVSILAALAILVALVLVLVLVRRRHRGHHKAAITTGHTGTNSGPIPAARNTQAAAYDNPSYKVDIQQETMDL